MNVQIRWLYNHPDDDIPVEYKWMVFKGNSESIYEYGRQFYYLQIPAKTLNNNIN